MNRIVRVSCLISLTLLTLAAVADVTGEWISPGGDALLKIVQINGNGATAGQNQLRVKLLRTLKPEFDESNPDVTMRGRRLQNIVLGEGFRANGDRWTGGRLYDPESGRTYKASLKLKDDQTLELRGYQGLPAFGRSQLWVRREVFERQVSQMLGAGEYDD